MVDLVFLKLAVCLMFVSWCCVLLFCCSCTLFLLLFIFLMDGTCREMLNALKDKGIKRISEPNRSLNVAVKLGIDETGPGRLL